MNEIQKFLIKDRKKAKLKAIGSLKIIIAVLLILISSTIFLFIISYKLRDGWTSNLLLSIGTGLSTGLIFYFLTNIRANKIGKLLKEVDFLKEIKKHNDELSNIRLQTMFENSMYYPINVDLDCLIEMSKDSIYGLYNSINNLPHYLYEGINVKNINLDVIELFKNIKSKNDLLCQISSIQKQISPIIDKVDYALKNKEIQISILNNRCL
jgi:uncharacterized protein (DUF486 family)